MRRTLGVVVWALASLGVAQPVALTHWDPFLAGPVGSVGHRGTDIGWWEGSAGQYRTYMTAFFQSGARGRVPIYENDRLGNALGGGLLQTAESQSVNDGKLAGGHSSAIYYAGSIVPSPGATRNIVLFQRGLSFAMGWNRFLDAGGDDRLVDVVVDHGEGGEAVYVLGTTNTAGVSRWFIAKYAFNGSFQFLRTGEAHSIATAIAVDPEGSTYTTYALAADGAIQSRIVKHSANGTYQWRTGYNPTTTQDVGFTSVAVGGGLICATGFVQAGPTTLRPMVAIYNGSGARLRSEVKTTVNGYFAKTLHAGRGTFYAAGSDQGPSKGLISALYDPEVGAGSVWYRKAAPAPVTTVSFVDAETDPWLNLYLAGNTGRPDLDGLGTFTAKYSPSGSSQWTHLNFIVDERREAEAISVHPLTGQVWAAGRYGADGFTYIAKSALSQVAITSNDAFEGETNVQVSGSVVENDCYWAEGSVQLVTPPVGGDLVLQPNGSFTYSPPGGFTGQKSFQYRIRRTGVSDSNVATVTLNIQ